MSTSRPLPTEATFKDAWSRLSEFDDLMNCSIIWPVCERLNGDDTEGLDYELAGRLAILAQDLRVRALEIIQGAETIELALQDFAIVVDGGLNDSPTVDEHGHPTSLKHVQTWRRAAGLSANDTASEILAAELLAS